MGKKQTQEEVLADFRATHGDRYDYSLVKYVRSKEPVKIKCLVEGHGVFPMLPQEHKIGRNCPRCAGNYTPTEYEVRKLFKGKHGDKFSYENMNYINMSTDINIECPIHGFFETSPTEHLKYNCKKCAGVYKPTTEEAIADFKEIYGNKYDFSKVIYVDSKTEVTVICKKHGIFFRSPNKLKAGQGCSSCSKINMAFRNKMSSSKDKSETLRKELFSIYGDKYSYQEVIYKNIDSDIYIKCKIHDLFPIKTHIALHNKKNICPDCFTLVKQKGTKYTIPKFNGKLNTSKVIQQFKAVHGDKYDYSKVNYIDSDEKVLIGCPIIEHGYFEQLSSDHKRGSGCNMCSAGGFNKKLPGILYYIRINKNGYESYKIGITNLSINDRFKRELKFITIIKQFLYDNGAEAYNIEQQILKDYSYAKWTGPSLLKRGDTEMFKYDILGWDI